MKNNPEIIYGVAEILGDDNRKYTLNLRWERKAWRYVWRTEKGTSVETGNTPANALDRLRTLYGMFTHGKRPVPTLIASALTDIGAQEGSK